MSGTKDNKRVAWVDIAKAIAIVCVIFGHSCSSKSDVSAVIVYSFHMPLFFILGGYTFKEKQFGRLLADSAYRLLVPYCLLFALLLLALVLGRNAISIGFFALQAVRFVFAAAVAPPQGGIPAVGIIWFLVALFFSRIALNTLLTCSQGWRFRFQKCALVLAAFTTLGVFVGGYAFLPFSLDVVPLTTTYMFAGYLAKEHHLMDRRLSPIVFVTVFAFWCLAIYLGWFSVGERAYGVIPISIFGAMAGSFIVAKLCQCIERFGGPACSALALVGRSSMLLFALHYLELNFLKWNTYPFMEVMGVTTATLFVARLAFIFLMAAVIRSVFSSRVIVKTGG